MKSLYDISVSRETDRRPRVIKKTDDDFMRDHEIALLSLLVRKHPDHAKDFLVRLKVMLPKAA
jgi:hypothetical protein